MHTHVHPSCAWHVHGTYAQVGLNLACACHVIFASPCLSAAVRKQAVGRCHRMGQARPVTVTTLCLAGTAEEEALALLHREDLPPRYAPNGREVSDQHTLRLAALEERALARGISWDEPAETEADEPALMVD